MASAARLRFSQDDDSSLSTASYKGVTRDCNSTGPAARCPFYARFQADKTGGETVHLGRFGSAAGGICPPPCLSTALHRPPWAV